MPWMAEGVYLPVGAAARTSVRAGFSALEDFAVFFAALLVRAAGFFAAARFFMPRTLQPARAAVNAPAGAAARR
jgi:hypothetical protein